MAVRKVMVSPVESTGVCQTPPDSTRLRWTTNQAESSGLVNWTGLYQTPLDYSPAVLSGSAMDMAGHSVWWSLVESAGVQLDYVGER